MPYLWAHNSRNKEKCYFKVYYEQFNFKIDSNRQKQDTVYFHDCGASVLRPKCIENIENGLLPQKWMD